MIHTVPMFSAVVPSIARRRHGPLGKWIWQEWHGRQDESSFRPVACQAFPPSKTTRPGFGNIRNYQTTQAEPVPSLLLSAPCNLKFCSVVWTVASKANSNIQRNPHTVLQVKAVHFTLHFKYIYYSFSIFSQVFNCWISWVGFTKFYLPLENVLCFSNFDSSD